ncbi:MAG TPA: HlyD family secretion protein [Gemmatimonadales bacterium]|nr:HlyD family secretion protein [Gemmatimonadales bacterium]
MTAAVESATPEVVSTTRRPPVVLIIGAVLAVAALTWGYKTYTFSRSHVETDNAQVDGHITPIAPKVQAFVNEVLVEENQSVRQGDTLVRLDPRDLQLKLAQAEADYATALTAVGTRARTGAASAQLAATQAQAQSAQAAVSSAEAALRKATSDLERVKGLAAQQIVPAQQLDAAQAAYDAAKANLESAQRTASSLTSQVSASGAAVGAAQARLASAQAAVENARLQLSYTVIISPISGTIARRSVEPGALVSVGQTLMSVIPDSGVWVTANLKETQLAGVDVGDPATFTVDAYGGREFKAHVESVSPATGARFALLPPDNATGNFTKVVQRVPVRLRVDGPVDPAHPLRPGMSVVATIATR